MVLTEITGQLIGGPEDGNLVSSTVERIYIEDTTKSWLDGTEQGKLPVIVVTTGYYIWQQDRGYFKWELEGTRIMTRA